MTLTELLEVVKSAPDDQLEGIELDLAAAATVVKIRRAKIAPPQQAAEPLGDMTADEVMVELALKKRHQVYSLATRPFDPLPSYNVNSRVKRFPRAAVAEWKKRQSERRG